MREKNKIIKSLAAVLLCTFLLGTTAMAAPTDATAENEYENVPVTNTQNGDTAGKAAFAPMALAPSMEVYSITVSPRYLISGQEGASHGLKAYTFYQPYGGYPYGLRVEITPAQKAAMDQAVVDKGDRTQIGYFYEIKLNFTYYSGARLEFSTPEGWPAIPLGYSTTHTLTYESTLAQPGFTIVGAHKYYDAGKEQGRTFTAVAVFKE